MAELYRYQEVLEFGPNEPAPYANRDVVVYLPGTTTPAAIFTDFGLTLPVANSTIRTDEFGELRFFSPESAVDLVRTVGGRRTLVQGDPVGLDELAYTKALFFI